MRHSKSLFLLGLIAFVIPALALAQDAGSGAPAFQAGDVISFDDVDKLKPFLPDEFWDNQDFALQSD